MNKKQILSFAFVFGVASSVWASGGQLSIGAAYDGWNTNYQSPAQDSGYEFYAPVALSYQFAPRFTAYAQCEYAYGNYVNTPAGTTSPNTVTLNDPSDTVVGGKLNFKSFSLNSIAEVALNIPTGNSSWESNAQISEPPTQFIDTRYTGRGWGASAFYGLSFPDGKGEYSAGAGYLYGGAFNPNYGNTTSLVLGDAIFGSVNRVTPISADENEIMRISVYQAFPTYENGVNTFQLGTNFNAAYNWSNTKALSFEVGGQFYLPSSYNGVTESHNSNGPRVYLAGSYAFGDMTLGFRGKFIFPNDYPLSVSDTYSYQNDGNGGWQVGLEPSMRFVLDDSSFLRLSASLDDIYACSYGLDANSNLTNVNFLYWTVHTEYVWKL